MFGVRGLDNASGLAGIVRQKHEDIDAALQQFSDLAKLEIIVAVGGAGDDGASEFMGALLKFIDVGLPPFALYGLEGKSDLDFFLLRLRSIECQEENVGKHRE